MPRENYFLLFGIEYNPPEENLQIIKSAIDYKVKGWGKEVNNPGPLGTEARYYLEKINEINEVLISNRALKLREAKEAYRIIKNKEAKAEKELDEVITGLSTKGYLTESESEALIKKYNILGKMKIMDKIQVPLKKNLNALELDENILPKSEERYINERLKFLGYRSLYEFLGVSTVSSIKLINYRIDLLYKTEIGKCIKDEKNNKIIDLLSTCKRIFSENDKRLKYDNTVKKERLDNIERLYLEPQKINKELHQNTYNFIVNKIIALGFTKDYGVNYVKAYCASKGIGFRLPIDFKIDSWKACGVCETLNSIEDNYCKGCRAKLEITCPGCLSKVDNSLIYCTYCNYPIGDMTNYFKGIERAREQRAKNNYDLALVTLENARVYYADSKELEALEEEIKMEKEAVKRNRKEIIRLQKEGFLYTMKELLLDPTFLLSKNYRREQLDKVDELLNRIEALLDIDKLENEEGKIYNLKMVSELCCDCLALEKIVKANPPREPSSCKYSIKENGISLSFSSKETFEVSYRIIRKKNIEPISVNDGKIIYEGEEDRFFDSDIEFGEKYFYSIFTKRLGVFSKRSVVIGPVMVIKEVDVISVKAYINYVSIDMKVPAKAIAVKCFKSVIDQSSLDNTKSELIIDSKDTIIDYDVKQSFEYSYNISCVYKDIYGESINSKGVTFKVKIPKKPEPLGNLIIKKNNTGVFVDITNEVQGKVYIYYSKENISELSYKIFEDRISDENILLAEAVKDNSYFINLKKECLIYILPIIKKDGFYFAEKAIQYNFIREISGLKGENIDNKIYLTWSFPETIERVLITYRTDGIFPKDPRDIESKIIPVSREMYLEEGFFKLNNIATGEYYFKVFTMKEEDSKVNYSEGVELKVSFYKNITLGYKIEKKKKLSSIFNNERLLFINISISESSLDNSFKALVLVRKDKGIPIDINDGEQVLIINKDEVINNIYEGAVKYKDREDIGFFRLFVLDDNKYNKYNIIESK